MLIEDWVALPLLLHGSLNLFEAILNPRACQREEVDADDRAPSQRIADSVHMASIGTVLGIREHAQPKQVGRLAVLVKLGLEEERDAIEA